MPTRDYVVLPQEEWDRLRAEVKDPPQAVPLRSLALPRGSVLYVRNATDDAEIAAMTRALNREQPSVFVMGAAPGVELFQMGVSEALDLMARISGFERVILECGEPD